ncbi:MAG: gliding motility-associated C-terminal domain-containing protein, partial [Bacteroidota bacterium]
IGQETNYVFSEILPQNTEIFVTITPYNIDGVATTCLQESFETASDEGQEIKLGFSPDGDGINDFWQIAGIEKYPDNFVTIYNRWGDIVFEISGYNNRSQVFRGTANRYVSAGAKELPEGTYFFHIRINGAHDLERVKGYLVLKR